MKKYQIQVNVIVQNGEHFHREVIPLLDFDDPAEAQGIALPGYHWIGADFQSIKIWTTYGKNPFHIDGLPES